MNKTKIEWCDITINPIIGCSPVSEGCINCYARKMAKRLAANPATPEYADVANWDGTVKFLPERLKRIPGKGKRVFIGSMTDLFHESVPDEWRDKIFGYVAANPQHTFIVLTKRPERMYEYFEHNVDNRISNLWIGVSVENQRTADERIPWLLRTPAAKRVVSLEPMLELVSLKWIEITCDETAVDFGMKADNPPRPDWIIVGAETGPNKRPMRIEWAESIYEQCQTAGVPFFGKKDSNGDPLRVYGNVIREWPE